MRKASVVIASVVIVIVAIAIVFPLCVGTWVKNSYENLVSFYNAQGNFHIQIVSYKRQWYGAKANLSINMLNFPQPVKFSVDQTIKYGPIFVPSAKNLPLHLGIATIYSEVHIAEGTGKIIQPENVNEPLIKVYDRISLTGNYSTYFQANGFRMMFVDGTNQLYVGDFSGNLILNPKKHVLGGDVGFSSVTYTIPQISFAAPKVTLMFHEHQTTSGLWLGNSIMAAESLTVQDSAGKTITLTDVHTTGDAHEDKGKLSGKKLLSIAKIKFEAVELGPLDLEMSAHELDSAAVAKLVSTYKKVYSASEKMSLVKELFGLFPSLFAAKSSINIDRLKVKTFDGNVLLTGSVNWPPPHTAVPQTPIEIFQAANAEAKIDISVKLAKEMMGLAADVKYIIYRLANPQQAYFEMQKNTNTVERQNALLMAVMMQNNQITKDVGLRLLALEKANTSLEDYSKVLNDLTASHQLTAPVAKMLRSQYEKILVSALTSEGKMQYLEDKFADQFEKLVKDGYITKKDDDYLVTVSYLNGVAKMNGKLLPS